MASKDSYVFAATGTTFKLMGGAYVIDAIATWGGGSLTLQRLGPNGSSYLDAATAITADGVTSGLCLPPGTYRFTVVTATGVSASITRVPGD